MEAMMETKNLRIIPSFPLYIVSKGRWESRLTSKALEKANIPYFIIIEHQEYNDYASVIDKQKILILNPEYQNDYDARMNLLPGQSKGSGPARNFAWDHSVSLGYTHHWVMDDNIRSFQRVNKNKAYKVFNGSIFCAMEDFCLRYKNIAMAGPQYRMFCNLRKKQRPFVLNSRIFSCNLIKNSIPFRWRCRYNEDADLSLRILKAGWCTVLFYAFLQQKITTQVMKGGNTDEIYKGGTLAKSQMLVREHPDVVRIAYRYGRWHHHINMKPFLKNKLIRNPDNLIAQGENNYGMVLAPVSGK